MIRSMDFNEKEKNLIIKGLELYMDGLENATDPKFIELLRLKNKIETYFTVSKAINTEYMHINRA